MIKYDSFIQLASHEIAQIVQSHGDKVCVFPINGTRRWFLMEYPHTKPEEFATAYLNATIARHIDVYRIIFDHGISTLLAPVFGHDLWERGDAYIQMAVRGFMQLIEDPRFLKFYEEEQVRIFFYGDYEDALVNTPYSFLLDVFAKVTDLTSRYERNRLFFGLFANDATHAVAKLSVDYFQKNNQLPNKETLIKNYYGDDVAAVDFFIGFDKFSSFDMPLVATGTEDLYFLVSPSLYITPLQLRSILYDHLFLRKIEPDYQKLNEKDLQRLHHFYMANQNSVLGIGKIYNSIWYPFTTMNQEFDHL